MLVSAPTPPVSAATCVLTPYPPASATVILSPSRPVTGEPYIVSGSGFPGGVTSVRIDVTGPGPGSTANAPVTGGNLLGIQLIAPSAEGRYTMRLTTPGSTAVNCDFTFRVVTEEQAAATTTTTTIDPTVTTSTIPGETTTSTTSTTLPPREDWILTNPGDVVTVGDFSYSLNPDRPAVLELNIQGLAPGSTGTLNVRVLHRVHRADFEDDPFDPLAPYDMTLFVNAADFELVPQAPVLGSAPTPVQVDPEDERIIGPTITGATILDLEELGITVEELFAQLSTTAVPFPNRFADDPVIAGATRWFLFDVVIHGGTPGFNANVFWYSIPEEVARAEVGPDGTARFQAAVPATMVTTGESDTLRVVSVYPAGTAIADANGFIATDVVLSDEILYFAEKGSFASILFTGLGASGEPKEGSVDVLIDALTPEKGFEFGWWVWVVAALLLLLLLLLLLWLLRRRDDEDDYDETLPGDSGDVPPPPPPGGDDAAANSSSPVAGMADPGSTPPPPPPPA